MLPDFTLSDFCNMEVVEDQETGQATVIIDYHWGLPVTLGFRANPELSDFEIQEEAFVYYCQIKEQLEQDES